MPPCLRIVCGYFGAATAVVSGCNKDRMACEEAFTVLTFQISVLMPVKIHKMVNVNRRPVTKAINARKGKSTLWGITVQQRTD